VASVVDISNLALSHLGDAATVASIDPPEGSAQAEHCARFYPVARDALLEMHPWNFATRRSTLAELAVPTWSWAYAYAVPSGTVKMLAVLPSDARTDDPTQPYETESAADGSLILRTNQQAATARYTVRIDDPTRFSPLFVDALARLLAAYLAGPVVKGESGRKAAQEQMQFFAQVLAQARISDANQRKVELQHTPAWIGDR
jgi:hypothetical protein